MQASKNSLKNGAYSNLVVLPGEDERDFKKLEDQFVSDFSPQDIAEASMVRELAIVVWKKLRLERLEQSAALSALNRSFDDYDFVQYDIDFTESRMWVLDELDSFDVDFVKQHQEMVGYAIRHNIDNLSIDDVNELVTKHPNLYRLVVSQAQEEGFFEDHDPTPAEIEAQKVVYIDGSSDSLVSFVINGSLEFAHTVVWAYPQIDKIKAAVNSIKEARLLNLMGLDKPRRVNDDLSRNFFRTLSELRKHQQWRFAKNSIDVTPKPTDKLL